MNMFRLIWGSILTWGILWPELKRNEQLRMEKKSRENDKCNEGKEIDQYCHFKKLSVFHRSEDSTFIITVNNKGNNSMMCIEKPIRWVHFSFGKAGLYVSFQIEALGFWKTKSYGLTKTTAYAMLFYVHENDASQLTSTYIIYKLCQSAWQVWKKSWSYDFAFRTRNEPSNFWTNINHPFIRLKWTLTAMTFSTYNKLQLKRWAGVILLYIVYI